MNDIGITLFEGLYASFEDARSTLRINKRDIILRVFCTGIELERDSTETGLHNNQQGTIRFLLADEPKSKIKMGDLIEIKTPSMKEYQKCRVNTRDDIGGAVRLGVEAKFK